MRISKVAKKSMAVAMAMAVAVGSVAVAPTKVLAQQRQNLRR